MQCASVDEWQCRSQLVFRDRDIRPLYGVKLERCELDLSVFKNLVLVAERDKLDFSCGSKLEYLIIICAILVIEDFTIFQ